MTKATRKRKAGHSTNVNDIVEKCSCDSNDPKCMAMIVILGISFHHGILTRHHCQTKVTVNQIVMMKLMELRFQCEFAKIKIKKETKYFYRRGFTINEENGNGIKPTYNKCMQVYV